MLKKKFVLADVFVVLYTFVSLAEYEVTLEWPWGGRMNWWWRISKSQFPKRLRNFYFDIIKPEYILVVRVCP